MSGRKRTNIRLDNVREQKNLLLNQINTLQNEINGIQRQVQQVLSDASEGVKSHFAQEAETARQWLTKILSQSPSDPLSLSSDMTDLRDRSSQLQTAAQEGWQIHQRLGEAFVKQAGQLRADGARKLFAVDSVLNRGQGLLTSWYGEEEVQSLTVKLDHLRAILDMDRLEEVNTLGSALQQEVEDKVQAAENIESQHQRRLYVLKALRQVCSEMGFREIRDPYFEYADDRKSRIVLTVDTFNRGEVSFHLALDAIEANSCIADNYCYEEFSQLSNQLSDKFGVITKFQMADTEGSPRLIQKGEMDEPCGVEKSSES
jgi:hypothetical protein